MNGTNRIQDFSSERLLLLYREALELQGSDAPWTRALQDELLRRTKAQTVPPAELPTPPADADASENGGES